MDEMDIKVALACAFLTTLDPEQKRYSEADKQLLYWIMGGHSESIMRQIMPPILISEKP